MMKTVAIRLIFAVLMLGVINFAHASLINDQVTLSVTGTTGVVFDETAPVDNLPEFTRGITTVDILASQITVAVFIDCGGVGPPGSGCIFFPSTDEVWQVSSLDWLPDPGKIVDVTPSIELGLSVFGLGFTDSSISFQMDSDGSLCPSGSLCQFQFTLDIDAIHSVPEPTTLLLLGLGLAGLGFARKRLH